MPEPPPPPERLPQPGAARSPDPFSGRPRLPQETSDDMAAIFAGVTDEASRRRAIAQWLQAAALMAVLVPVLFLLENYALFRKLEVGELGWGVTVFFVVYCLLWAIGLFFRPRTEFHTTVRLKRDWADRIGAFWLVGCAFGPFLGWIATSEVIPITGGSWRWLYGVRFVLAAAMPVILALPLLRYVRGKAALVQLPLLIGITLLPVLSALHVGQDLWEGPVVRQASSAGPAVHVLAHTGRRLEE